MTGTGNATALIPTQLIPTQLIPTVLIVDDEVMILDLLQDAFESGGRHVLTTATAGTAFAVLEEHAPEIDGIVTDVNIGANNSGWDVARPAR